MALALSTTTSYVLNQDVELDPYKKALQTNLGHKIAEHNRLETILRKLNPRDYLDWDELSHRDRFDVPESYY